MKKSFSTAIILAVNVILFMLIGGNGLGSNGLRGAGGFCGQKDPGFAEEDADNDGIPNDADNCPEHFNPSQTDEDDNGVGEICETFEPFDGVIECPLAPCDNDEDCIVNLAAQCPAEENELNFFGLFLACCDNACIVKDPNKEEKSLCPAGSCNSPSPHCTTDEECFGAGYGPCVGDCCVQAPI